MIENPIAFLILYNAIVVGIIYGKRNLKKAILFYIPALLASTMIIYEHLTKIEKFVYFYIIFLLSVVSIVAIWKNREKKQKIQYRKPRGTTYEQAKENLRKHEIKKEIEKQKSEIPQYIEIDLSELFKPDKKSNNYSKKREFRPFTAEERKAYGQQQREIREQKKQKGNEYEEYIAKYYKSLGYEVIEHGKIMGRRDGGIDLIAKNHREAIMIQCKNWNAENKYTINHETISAFVGKVSMFLAKNTEYEKYEIKRIFTVSEPILDRSALEIINENREMIRYEHIPLPLR